jgi:hypothetical protein
MLPKRVTLLFRYKLFWENEEAVFQKSPVHCLEIGVAEVT